MYKIPTSRPQRAFYLCLVRRIKYSRRLVRSIYYVPGAGNAKRDSFTSVGREKTQRVTPNRSKRWSIPRLGPIVIIFLIFKVNY